MHRFKNQDALPPNEVAAHPGYVRLVLPPEDAQARSACRQFSELCGEESANRGLIVAQSSSSNPGELEHQIALATGAVCAGFRLAVVAQGKHASRISRIATATAARRRARARIFSSEHQAAAWLMS